MWTRVREIVAGAVRDFAADVAGPGGHRPGVQGGGVRGADAGDRAVPALAAVADGLPGRRRRRHRPVLRHHARRRPRAHPRRRDPRRHHRPRARLPDGDRPGHGARRAGERQERARVRRAGAPADILRLTGHMVRARARRPRAVPPRDRRSSTSRSCAGTTSTTSSPASRPSSGSAVALAAVIVVALAALLVRTIARWALALPLLLFEGVHPRRALGASAARSAGHRGLIVLVLAAWAVSALALGGRDQRPRERPRPRRRAAPRRLAGDAPPLPRRAGRSCGPCSAWRWRSSTCRCSRCSSSASTCTPACRARCGCPRRRAPAWIGAGRLSARARLVVAGVAVLLAVGVSLLAVRRHPRQPAGAGDRAPRRVGDGAREHARRLPPRRRRSAPTSSSSTSRSRSTARSWWSTTATS